MVSFLAIAEIDIPPEGLFEYVPNLPPNLILLSNPIHPPAMYKMECSLGHPAHGSIIVT